MSGIENRGATTFVGASGKMVMDGHNELPFDNRLQDFKTIVSRPFVIGEGVFATGVVGLVYQSSIYDIFANSPYRALFNWCAGMRFTAHFRLVIANSPFVQGMVTLAHLPNGGNGTQSRLSYTSTVLQLPCVSANLNVDNEAVLCVPWDSSFDFLPIDEGRGFTATQKLLFGGSVGLNITMPLKATDASFPSYTLYASFHDIETVGEKPVCSVYAQSGDFVAAERSGMISVPLMLGSKALKMASDVFSPHIPLVGKVFHIGSWVTRFASKAFSAFGYSRPQVLDTAKRVYNMRSGFGHIADVDDYSINLSSLNDNRVIPDSRVTHEEDQMSLEYLLTRPGPIARANYVVSAAVGATVFEMPTAPAQMIWNGSATRGGTRPLGVTTTNSVIGTTALSYFGQMFQQWRGGFTYTLTAAKTPFHAGKLLVGWVPMSTVIQPVTPFYFGPVATNQPYLSMIWDLKADSSIEFSIPYISPLVYEDYGNTTGNFFIRVVEKLSHPTTVANNVDILISVRANPGFELAIPRTPSVYMPATQVQATAKVVAQSGSMSDLNPPQPLPELAAEETYDRTVAQYCVGERVASVKQLVMRGDLFKKIYTLAATEYATASITRLTHLESTSYIFGANIAVAGMTYVDGVASYSNVAGAAYAYLVGGFGMDFYPMSAQYNTWSTVYLNDNTVHVDFGVAQNNFLKLRTSNSSSPFTSEMSSSGALHVKIPYYCNVRRAPISFADSAFADTMNALNANPCPDPYLVVGPVVEALGQRFCGYLYRRAADDTVYTRYLGAPLAVVAVETLTNYTNNSIGMGGLAFDIQNAVNA